ncbi:hypothetical protein N7540_011208 [Penicillium herquei]|nr:hypothetical protein N7540_013081 [Penicillium herquei]KAJ6016617.1 hypothetical protein N7540_011208 [Penicillium herquei]
MSQLSLKANSIRKEIKQIIAHATPKGTTAQNGQDVVYKEDDLGNRSFEGKRLSEKVTQFMNEIGRGEGWRWNLAYFPKPKTPIINESSQMYIVPLSEEVNIIPGGDVAEGTIKCVPDTPVLSLPSTILFIMS